VAQVERQKTSLDVDQQLTQQQSILKYLSAQIYLKVVRCTKQIE
jgi:hypothetical protein